MNPVSGVKSRVGTSSLHAAAVEGAVALQGGFEAPPGGLAEDDADAPGRHGPVGH